MSEEQPIEPDTVRIDLHISGVRIFLKAVNAYLNTRNLSDEDQRMEYELLLETYYRLTDALRQSYK